jgi:hypothetical protein
MKKLEIKFGEPKIYEPIYFLDFYFTPKINKLFLNPRKIKFELI